MTRRGSARRRSLLGALLCRLMIFTAQEVLRGASRWIVGKHHVVRWSAPHARHEGASRPAFLREGDEEKREHGSCRDPLFLVGGDNLATGLRGRQRASIFASRPHVIVYKSTTGILGHGRSFALSAMIPLPLSKYALRSVLVFNRSQDLVADSSRRRQVPAIASLGVTAARSPADHLSLGKTRGEPARLAAKLSLHRRPGSAGQSPGEA